MRVAGGDVRLQMLEGFAGVSDVPGQVAELPADFVLLVEMHGAQLVELATSVSILTFSMTRDCPSDGLDFRVGKRAAFKVLGAAHRGVAGHDLLDEAGLGLQGLPHRHQMNLR